MKKLMALAVAFLMLAAVCIIPVAAERVEAGGYYEYPAEKTDEIIAGKAGEASVRWSVPFYPVVPTLDGVISPNEYASFEGFEDYITLAVTRGYSADKADALYEKVQNGIFDAYWCWDGQYMYLAFAVDCVDGYSCSPEQDVLLFAYNCLQVGLADADAEGKDPSYAELGFGYDAERKRNITFTWSGAYASETDDFAGSYNADTQRVTYELRIDLQKVLGLARYPENGDQCNFAFSLEISGDNDVNTGAQVMFCHGMSGQYSMKRAEYFARITFEGKPNDVVIEPGPVINIPGNEMAYGLREVIDFSDTSVFDTMVGVGAALEQVTEGEDRFLRITAQEDGCYAYSTAYPKNLLSDARYLVIKYRSVSPKAKECGIIWKTRHNPDFEIENCYYDFTNPNGQWNYLLLEINGDPKWTDYILNLGIVPFCGKKNVAGEVMDIAWIKAYNLDPYDLYAEWIESEHWHEPEPEPPQTQPFPEMTGQGEPTFAPDTTEPYYEETVVQTEWETFHEQEVPGNNLGGLFFEVFGDDALSGCKSTPAGCGAGGCNAVTGGLLLIGLLAAGAVFTKKE